MNIVEFLVKDGSQRGYTFNQPFVARILQDVMEVNPMGLISIDNAIKAKQSNEGDFEQGQEVDKFLEELYPMLKGAHSSVVDAMLKDGQEVVVNKDGDMVFVVEGTECRI